MKTIFIIFAILSCNVVAIANNDKPENKKTKKPQKVEVYGTMYKNTEKARIVDSIRSQKPISKNDTISKNKSKIIL